METKNRIGIKYCGGCNPTYERVEVMREVQSRLGQRFFFLPSEQKNLHGLLAINGCNRSCAIGIFDDKAPPHFSISTGKDFELLIDWLVALDEQANS